MRTLRVGDVEVTALTDYDGPFMAYEEGFPGVGAEEWEPFQARYPLAFAEEGRTWRAAFNCYLLRAGDEVTLIDTGIGAESDGMRGRLVEELAACGVAREDVRTVVFTHLHSDHIGWNLEEGVKPFFPNARYLIARGAWTAAQTAASQDDYSASIARALSVLEARGVVGFFAPGEAGHGAVTLATPGHAPEHLSVMITSGDQRLLVVGDALLHPAQVTRPDIASVYDEDPEEARTTRERLLEMAEREGLMLAVSHIPVDGFGRVISEDGLRHWQPI